MLIKKILLVASFTLACWLSVAGAQEVTDYKQDVNELKQRLDSAVQHYRAGDASKTRRILQQAYLEIFEGLEPSIRMYVSPRTNLEMEKELSLTLPKNIKNKIAVETFANQVDLFKQKLDAVLPKIQGKAGMQAQGVGGITAADVIAPEWQDAFAKIENGLADALRLFRSGDNAKAAKQVKDVQFKYYKNTELETALRRYKSAAAAAAINTQFAQLIKIMTQAKPLNEVAYAISNMLSDIAEKLPNLPVTEKKSVIN